MIREKKSSDKMQNLVFMEPTTDGENISIFAGRLFLNEFCMEEDTACELLAVEYLAEWSRKLLLPEYHTEKNSKSKKSDTNRKEIL